MNGEPDDDWERSNGKTIFDEFVVSSTPTGSSFMLKGRSTSDVSAVFRPLLGDCSELEVPYAWNSQPSADPMLPVPPSAGSLESLWGPASINSTALQAMYPDTRQTLPTVTTSQISYALADSQLRGNSSQFVEPFHSSPFPSSPSIRELLHRQPSFSQSEPDMFTGERIFLAAVSTNPIVFRHENETQNEENGGGGGAEEDKKGDFLGGRSSVVTPATQEDPDVIAVENQSADQKDFEGKIGFRLRFPNCPGKDWIYVEDEKTLYLKAGAFFDIQFILAKAAPLASLICARAVFMSQGVFGKPVPRVCEKHLHDSKKAFLSTDYKKAQTDAHETVIFPLPVAKRTDKQQNSMLATRFALKCRNSCFGFKKRIGLIFEVVCDSSVLARARIDVRSCANPERDSKPLKESETKKGQKRKSELDEKSVLADGGVKIKKETHFPVEVGSAPPQWAVEKHGVEQVYGRHSDGSLWLRLEARVRPEAEVFINQIITTGAFLDGLCATQWGPSLPPPLTSLNTTSSPPSSRGVSSSVIQPKLKIRK